MTREDQRGPRCSPAPRPASRLADARLPQVPIAIQDRSFNGDGALFYPDSREFFEGSNPSRIPFIPVPVERMGSDVPPIWNPEFFGNTIVVNGKTWPKLEVESAPLPACGSSTAATPAS